MPTGSLTHKTTTRGATAGTNRLHFPFSLPNRGPPMTYYSGSLLQIEWTAQHACGADHPKADCDIILQYMCSPDLRDGLTTDTITAETASEKQVDPKTGEETWKYGMHESAEYFAKCKERQRNGVSFQTFSVLTY